MNCRCTFRRNTNLDLFGIFHSFRYNTVVVKDFQARKLPYVLNSFTVAYCIYSLVFK